MGKRIISRDFVLCSERQQIQNLPQLLVIHLCRDFRVQGVLIAIQVYGRFKRPNEQGSSVYVVPCTEEVQNVCELVGTFVFYLGKHFRATGWRHSLAGR